MARAKLDDAVIFEIKSYRSQKVQRGDRWIPMPLDAIEEKMQETRNTGLVKSDMPGRGSIQKYAREYDDLPDSIKAFDEPFAWSRIGEYDLPWEAGAFVLLMWKFVNDDLRKLTWVDYSPPPPTYREVLWWWRVHLSDAPKRTLDPYNIWAITMWIIYRELKHELLGVPLYLADIEAFLAYRPWIEGQEDAYELAIVEGLIPGIDYSHLWGEPSEILQGRDNPEFVKAVKWLAFEAIGRPSLEIRKKNDWDATKKSVKLGSGHMIFTPTTEDPE